MLPEAPIEEAARKRETSAEEKPPGKGNPLARSDDAPMWLQRSSLVLLVVTCIYIGLLLVVLPWSHYWQENRFFAVLPERWVEWLQLGSVRGVVSGLGLLDIWIGLSEAVHWRSRR
jgi:hypothetical protein